MKQNAFNVRRRFAKVSFIAILITLFWCLGIATFGEPSAAENLKQIGLIIGPICAFLTTIVGGYMGSVAYNDKKDVK